MTTILVWVLLVVPAYDGYGAPKELGPYADQASCERVKSSQAWNNNWTTNHTHFTLQCVQVRKIFPTRESGS
jgi:hypothetical protein